LGGVTELYLTNPFSKFHDIIIIRIKITTGDSAIFVFILFMTEIEVLVEFLFIDVTVENQRMVYWRGNSAENQDTNGKLGPKPYRERYHPGMDEQCGRSGWLAGSRSERCLTIELIVIHDLKEFFNLFD
jgi:hypothetical protein